MKTVTISQEDADFIQESFTKMLDKIEELELQLEERQVKPIDEVLNLDGFRSMFVKEPKEEKGLEVYESIN